MSFVNRIFRNQLGRTVGHLYLFQVFKPHVVADVNASDAIFAQQYLGKFTKNKLSTAKDLEVGFFNDNAGSVLINALASGETLYLPIYENH